MSLIFWDRIYSIMIVIIIIIIIIIIYSLHRDGEEFAKNIRDELNDCYSLFLLQDILNINSNGGPKEVFTTA